VITVFYLVCGAGVTFYAFFFLKCCRQTSKKQRQWVRKLPAPELPSPEEQKLVLAHLEKQMADFGVPQGRGIPVLLLAALLLTGLPESSGSTRLGEVQYTKSEVSRSPGQSYSCVLSLVPR
jgi:hypothetical protein